MRRINHRWGDPSRPAVVYLDRALDEAELVAHYLAADLMCVTPLRDGMNLVAKEYVATRTDHSGALVLSELAGVARELREATLVNPYDVEGMAAAFEAALERPGHLAAARMRAPRKRVGEYDVGDWAAPFLGFLEKDLPASKVRRAPLRSEPQLTKEGVR